MKENRGLDNIGGNVNEEAKKNISILNNIVTNNY